MRRRHFLGTLAAFGCTAAAARGAPPSQGIELGDEVFLREHARELAGRRIGVITNQTGVTSSGRSIVDAIRANTSLDLRAIYAPEHGLRGDRPAGAFVASYVDSRTNLPVYSLYGPDRHPSAQMLAGIDVLLFDIQDVGARAYTFVSTMAFALQSAAAHGIEFWVLDRPNPVGGDAVEGPVLDPRFSSFIGLYPIPMRHGMTVGELARLYNQHFGIGAKLRVITMNGWKRSMIWPQTRLRWTQTSPNIPTWQTTFVYLCTGLIDDAGVNNGVGTDAPFFFAGTPGLDTKRFAASLRARDLPGVAFHPAVWSPSRGGNAGRTFSGVELILVDPAQFVPVRAAVEILVAARDLQHEAIHVSAHGLDLDWGTDTLRRGLLAGKNADEIVTPWKRGVEAFAPLREKYLLYS